MSITYANGSVPAGLLAPLDGQPEARPRADAAASWNRARADVERRTGITLRVRGWNRTLAEQERFFHERYEPRRTGGIDVRWYKGVRYARVRGAAAAIPGTSNHGYGIAIDVEDYGTVGDFDHPRRLATFPILAAHGWTDTEGRGAIREPWHLVYDPARDTRPVSRPGAGAGQISTPTIPGRPAPLTPTHRERDRPMLLTSDSHKARGVLAVLALGGGWCEIRDPAEIANLRAAGIPLVPINNATLDELVRDARGRYWAGGEK